MMHAMSIRELATQEEIVVDRERLGRYNVADFLPAQVAVGYLARTHRGVRWWPRTILA